MGALRPGEKALGNEGHIPCPPAVQPMYSAASPARSPALQAQALQEDRFPVRSGMSLALSRSIEVTPQGPAERFPNEAA